MEDKTLKELEAIEQNDKVDNEARYKADYLIKMFQDKMVFKHTMYKSQAHECAFIYAKNMVEEYREFVGYPRYRFYFWKKVRDYLS